MTRNLTCIICPRGCQLTVEIADGAVKDVKGFTCPRGKKYAVDECTNPVRTVTSTAKTDRATVTLPAHIGDVVIQNVLNTGANLVVTANRED